jgi:hypothetical protein
MKRGIGGDPPMKTNWAAVISAQRFPLRTILSGYTMSFANPSVFCQSKRLLPIQALPEDDYFGFYRGAGSWVDLQFEYANSLPRLG